MLVLKIVSLALLMVAVRSSVLPAIQELDAAEVRGPLENPTDGTVVNDLEKKEEMPLESPSLAPALEPSLFTDDEEAKQRHKKSPYIPPSYLPPSQYPVAPGYKPHQPYQSHSSSPICIEIRPKGCVTPFIICESPSHGSAQPYTSPQYGYARAELQNPPGQQQMQVQPMPMQPGQGQMPGMLPGQQGLQRPPMQTGQMQQVHQGRPTQQQMKPTQPAKPGQGPRSEKNCDSDTERAEGAPAIPKEHHQQVPQHARSFLPYLPHYPLYSPHYHHPPPPPPPLPTYVNPPAYVSSPLALSCQLHPHPYQSPSLLQLHLQPDHPSYGSAYRSNDESPPTKEPPTTPKSQVHHDLNVPQPKSDTWEKSDPGCVNPADLPRADAPQVGFGRDGMEDTMENQVFVNEVLPMSIM